MRPWKVYIFIQAVASVAFSFAYATEISSVTPRGEENSLDEISTKKFIPKISLHSLRNDCSLFNHYLESHAVAMPLKENELKWTFYLPKKAMNAPVFMEAESLALVKDLLIQLHDSSPPEEEEISMLTPFKSKDFLDDILSTLTKSREYQEIKALFEPEDNHAEIDLLQTYLSNSLEFKVLSHANRKALLLKAEEFASSSNKIIELTSSPLSKKIHLSQPQLTIFTSDFKEITLTALLNEQIIPNPSFLKEEERVIELTPTGPPRAISWQSNIYTYIPPEKTLPSIITAPFSLREKIAVGIIQNQLSTPLKEVAKIDISNLHFANVPSFPLIEPGKEIALTLLGTPQPLSQVKSLYSYTPALKTSLGIEKKSCSIEKKASLKKNQGDIAFQYTTVQTTPLKESRPEVTFKPNPDLIKTSYLSKITSNTSKKGLSPLGETELSMLVKLSDFPLSSSAFGEREKYYFIETLYDPSFPTKVIKISELSINEQVHKALPGIETNITVAKSVTLPFQADSSSIHHYFTTGALNKVNGDQLYTLKNFKSEKIDVIASSKQLTEISDTVYDRPCKEIGAIHLENEQKRLPNKEFISNEHEVYLTSLSLTKTSPFHPSIQSSAYYEDKHFPYAEGRIGRMERFIEKESLLFDKDSIPKYLEEVATSSIKLSNLKGTDAHEDDFSAKSEQFLLPYEYIVSSEINSSITPKVKQKAHSLAVTYSKVDQSRKISKQLNAITAEKDLPSSLAAVNFIPSEDVTIPINPIFQDGFVAVTPSFIHNNKIENTIAFSTKGFEGKVVLPKIAEISNERSFFLNPMLSLMGSENLDIQSDLIDAAHDTNRANRMTQYALFNWPTLDELQTDSFSEGFTLDTRLLSSTQTHPSDFACTLKTYENDLLNPLPLEILYILDTSSSIEPHRFKVFKDAIIGSMQYLEPDSRFNIAFLENGKVELLHKESVSPSASSLGYAKRSLRKKEQSNKTHLKDLVTFLKAEKSKAANDIAHHSCILLSDGNLAHNIRLDQDVLESLTAIDSGNFSMYTASVSDKNNKAMLSLLAKINHGFSLYTKTHSSFPRKFAMMLKHIKRPLLHDIHISFPDSDQTKSYFNDQIAPILLADKTFTFYGNTESKEKARVFIQGKSGDRWINILKELPVGTARKARFAAHQKLAGQKSLLSLYSFLTTKDEKYLIEAKDFAEDD